MSIYYSGTFKRSAGISSAIRKQLKLINLKPVKKIQVQFDPFHPKAVTIRDFLFHITTPSLTATSQKLPIKTNIVCDRSVPFVKIDLIDSGNSVKFLTDNLSVLEILQQFNKHISTLAKPDDTSEASLIQTKSEKKKNVRRK